MRARASHSEVKFKVREDALLLREFTISQLVRTTGLNPESVRTEVQRLKQKGFIVSERRPGQREVVYRLSDDPEKRLELSRSVRAFHPPLPEPTRPTARLYQAALNTLDQAERAKGQQRKELLDLAAHQLEGAWQAEGASRAPELVQAHLLRERGRLAYLQGTNLDQARQLLEQAREKFAAAGLESEVRLVDEYILCLDIESLLKARGARDIHEQVYCVLEVLNEAKQVGPLARLLIELIQSLSHSEARVIAAVYQGVTAVREHISIKVRLSSLQLEGLSFRPEQLSFPRSAPEYPAWEEPISWLDLWSRKPGGKLDA
jgi:DNA-binding transcriptional ArsR family regulator